MFHVYNYLPTTLKTNCYCMLQEYISWSILYCIYILECQMKTKLIWIKASLILTVKSASSGGCFLQLKGHI